MQEKFLNTEEAPNKWFAAYDARMRSLANQTSFSQAQQIQALAAQSEFAGFMAYWRDAAGVKIINPLKQANTSSGS